MFGPSRAKTDDHPPQADSKFRSIEGNKLEPIEFSGMREARDFLKRYEDVAGFSIYGLPKFEYVYINEAYPGEVVYDRDLIRIVNIDIEVASAEGFPNPDQAIQEVIAVSMKRGNEFVVIGF